MTVDNYLRLLKWYCTLGFGGLLQSHQPAATRAAYRRASSSPASGYRISSPGDSGPRSGPLSSAGSTSSASIASARAAGVDEWSTLLCAVLGAGYRCDASDIAHELLPRLKLH